MLTNHAADNAAFLCLIGLFVKHFICDFPLQSFQWMYRNKGTYLHPGGLVHAGIHGIGTFFTLALFTNISTGLYCALADCLVHYHIDWAKMNIGRRYDLQPNNSERFWILLGFDQLLHHLTYFALVFYAFAL